MPLDELYLSDRVHRTNLGSFSIAVKREGPTVQTVENAIAVVGGGGAVSLLASDYGVIGDQKTRSGLSGRVRGIRKATVESHDGHFFFAGATFSCRNYYHWLAQCVPSAVLWSRPYVSASRPTVPRAKLV